jgi:hypothetical protein
MKLSTGVSRRWTTFSGSGASAEGSVTLRTPAYAQGRWANAIAWALGGQALERAAGFQSETSTFFRTAKDQP